MPNTCLVYLEPGKLQKTLPLQGDARLGRVHVNGALELHTPPVRGLTWTISDLKQTEARALPGQLTMQTHPLQPRVGAGGKAELLHPKDAGSDPRGAPLISLGPRLQEQAQA